MAYAFSDVNFIPDEVDQIREQEIRKKSALKYMIILCGAVLLVGLSLLSYNLYTKSKIKSVIRKTEDSTAKIADLSDFGTSGYKLGVRLGVIKDILSSRLYYDNLVNEIDIQTPNNVLVTKIETSGSTDFSIYGISSQNYTPISVFQRNLQSSDTGYFVDVKLDSAKLNKDDGSVDFSLRLVLDNGKINVKRN
ncbi:hypothetical protein CO058_01175 [candidate division WWE3 bacterium CG_4_9_14_0_2_um_filter_35_11]|uniref:Uncharacterized protein n=1 Tax=candidate division WWE3 bacterium CG_4_9_14_0_2_um_filter_35_11 TaxID=1975077 RepID=A0A2M8EM89_UNCKA|nr:MAG: hypothetical protein COV25_02995 [candidate division WWE3 bacterium CG10_big_fil_rev_8_21_14_0_10_35_32]PJC23852.1 MAG: hypothetical protein CO058_01175 [candidate division WWE3 bacterium CG_4_9_14_0_2_um_filter_35_11]